ncbi:MAG: NTP transferase domain-containing protein [Acetobacteraceae bacterium]
MIFRSLPLAEAMGAIMGHSLRLSGRMLRKGSILDGDAIAALKEAGHENVVAARLEAGEVPEDLAADRLAEALLTPLIGRSRAATGRVNFLAEVPGLLRVAAVTIERMNLLDEALTLATLPDYAVVAPKEMVATIKIIPFAVAATTLAVAEALARQEKPLLTLHPFRPYKVGLVMTELSAMKESVVEHTIAATGARVAALTGTLLPARRCRHEVEPIAGALQALISEGAEMLLVAGASAVVDRNDVGPQGIVRAGGHIIHFGMPVDPGNLICVGAIGAKPALVLPGCARSPKLNGIDFVLARLFAGLPVGAAEIASLGVGGLLKEIETRPMPRAQAPAAPRVGAAPRARPTVAAIVLAAGRSRRMAPHNKLLIIGPSGKPIIARVVDNVLSSAARPVLVVTGHQAREIEHTLGGRPVRYVHAPDYAEGLSASLKAGIAAVPPESPGAVICLGDMPLVTGRMIDRLLAAFDPDEGRAIVLPSFRGKQGNPMVWGRRFFPEIAAITGDIGARHLASLHLEQVVEVEIADEAVLRDLDTPEALARMPQRF